MVEAFDEIVAAGPCEELFLCCSFVAEFDPDRAREPLKDPLPVVDAKLDRSNTGTGGIGTGGGGSVYNSYKLTKDIPDLYASLLLALAASESALLCRGIGSVSSFDRTGSGSVGGRARSVVPRCLGDPCWL